MRRLVLAILLSPSASFAQDKVTQAPDPDVSSMVAFEAGTFSMGQPYESASAYGDEWFIDQQPAHDVTLGEFRMDPREVTVAGFALFLTFAAGEYHFDPDQLIERVQGGYLPMAGKGDEPIRYVTWQAAHDYCLWAGKTLPTEAQWERAAAGTGGREYPWGDEAPTCAHAVFFTGARFCEQSPIDVGSRPQGATPEGLEDMAGNVAEWVADLYGPYPAGDAVDPQGPIAGTYRVVRGGGHLEGAQMLRARARWGADPALRSGNVGFRCAYVAAPTDGALRGTLVPPADVGREPADRPLAPPVPGPATAAADLGQPVALVSMAGSLYVADRSAGRLFEILDAGAIVEVPLDGPVSPWGLATDGTDLFLTDDASGDVLRIGADHAVATLASGQNAPRHVAADAGEVYWSTDDGIMGYTEAGGIVLVAEVTGVTGLATSATHLFFTSSGGAMPADAMTGRVPRDGGEVEVIGTYGVDHYPTAVIWEPGSARAFILHRKRAWPADGHLSQWAEGMSYPITFAYTLPDPGPGMWHGQSLYWATQTTLVSIQVGLDTTYETVQPWTRCAGLVEHDGALHWIDSQDGRLYRAFAW